jgi:lysophospholipase L1-like esterase
MNYMPFSALPRRFRMNYRDRLATSSDIPMQNFLRLPAIGMLAAAFAAGPSRAADTSWVTSWMASPQPAWHSGFILPTNVPRALDGDSIRELVQLSSGGESLRLVFSNRYGSVPLVIGEVRVALALHESETVGGTDRAVTFGGQRSVTVPPGADGISDPLRMKAGPLARLAISSYYPLQTELSSFHWGDQQTAYIMKGNATGAPHLRQANHLKGRAFLNAVLVNAAAGTRTVVALGDSTTDGNGSTPDSNRRWPDYLARRLAGTGVAVANAGISGARLLDDMMGVNALARFEHDVLAQPGASTVVVYIGINDIGWPGSPFAPAAPPMRAEQLIAGYRQLIVAARVRGVRIVGATITPFSGALRGTPLEGHFSLAKDAVRRRVNDWIRGSGEFDAVADFDKVLRDPRDPARLLAEYDSGDHLHPGDAGYEAIARSLDDATLFGTKRPALKERP